MTVGELIDRIYRQWIYRFRDRPPHAELVNDITATDPTMTLDVSQFTFEEQAAMIDNVIAEIDGELVRITAFDFATGVATIRRSQEGTLPAAHTATTLCYLSPEYTRQMIFDALADEIVGLYPELWRLETIPAVSESFVELPENSASIVGARTIEGIDISVQLVTGFDEVDTGVAAIFDPYEYGQTVWITVSSAFARPTSEADELAALGVSDNWVRLLIFGTVGNLLRGKEIDLASVEFLTEAIESSAVNLGQVTNVATALLRIRDQLVRRETQALIQRQGTRVVMTRVI